MPRKPPPIVTFTTDFGLADPYVGQMHGVALGINPALRMVDLTHHVQPQNIRHGAAALEAAVEAFPANTIHVGVIDPGVGSDRAGIAIESNAGPIFVGPDNGLFDLALDRLGGWRQIVRLENPTYQRQVISDTFHGRDIFAPAAAHLATGVALANLGPSQEQLVSLDLPEPEQADNAITAQVLYVDHFGNAITTLARDAFPNLPWRNHNAWRVVVNQRTTMPMARTFSDVGIGKAVAYVGSSSRLELAIRNGDLAATHRVTQGDSVVIQLDHA